MLRSPAAGVDVNRGPLRYIAWMRRNVQILDYDNIDEWSPWFDEIMGEIGPADLIERLHAATPEYIEDARDLVVSMVGRPRPRCAPPERLGTVLRAGLSWYARHGS